MMKAAPGTTSPAAIRNHSKRVSGLISVETLARKEAGRHDSVSPTSFSPGGMSASIAPPKSMHTPAGMPTNSEGNPQR